MAAVFYFYFFSQINSSCLKEGKHYFRFFFFCNFQRIVHVWRKVKKTTKLLSFILVKSFYRTVRFFKRNLRNTKTGEYFFSKLLRNCLYLKKLCKNTKIVAIFGRRKKTQQCWHFFFFPIEKKQPVWKNAKNTKNKLHLICFIFLKNCSCLKEGKIAKIDAISFFINFVKELMWFTRKENT